MVGKYLLWIMVCLIGVGLCIVYQVDQKIQQRLQEKHVEYSDVLRYWDHYIFQNAKVRTNMLHHAITVSMAEVEVYWFPSYTVHTRGVDITINPLRVESQGTFQEIVSDTNSLIWNDIPVFVQQMSVHSPYGNLENLHGTLSSIIQLENKEFRLQATDNFQNIDIEGTIQYHSDGIATDNGTQPAEQTIDALEFSSDYHLHVQEFSRITGELESVTIKHALLGPPMKIASLPLSVNLQADTIDIHIGYLDSFFHSKSEGFSLYDVVEFDAKIDIADALQLFQIDYDRDWKVSGFWDIKGRMHDKKMEELSIAVQKTNFVGDVSWVDNIRNSTVSYRPIHADSIRYIGMRQPQWISYSQLGHIPQSVLAGEDILFFSHNGFNTEGIHDAIMDYFTTGEIRGGSSITQQVAKNLFISTDRTIRRKVEESLYTILLESKMTKQEILEIYCNIVEFGSGLYGVHSATDAYFAKDPQNTNWKEAAFLVSILPNPRHYYRNAKKGKPPIYKMNRILDNAVRAKFISPMERIDIDKMPLHLLLPVE